MPTPLTDADKVLRNNTGIDIATNIASIASALTPSNITDLGDVNLTNPITDGQVIKYDTATQKWVNGLGNITMECTQAQYDAWKQSGQLKTNTLYVITDAPNLNATAQDISYDGSTDTVWDKVEAVKTALGQLPTEIRCGGGSYSGLKGGGHVNRVSVPIAFSKPMTGTEYAVFIVVSDAYNDYPYIRGYCFGGSRTVNGFTATILSMSSDTTTEISGSFYWVAVRYK